MKRRRLREKTHPADVEKRQVRARAPPDAVRDGPLPRHWRWVDDAESPGLPVGNNMNSR